MSEFLIGAILMACPGSATDSKGQIITTDCQESMVNCVIDKVGTNEPTIEEIASCADEYRNKHGRGPKIISHSK